MATGLRRLAEEMTGVNAPGNRPECWFESGIVRSSVTGYGNAAIVTVSWRGVDVPVSYLDSYNPSDGDAVLLLIQPPSPPVLLGKINGPGGI